MYKSNMSERKRERERERERSEEADEARKNEKEKLVHFFTHIPHKEERADKERQNKRFRSILHTFPTHKQITEIVDKEAGLGKPTIKQMLF